MVSVSIKEMLRLGTKMLKDSGIETPAPEAGVFLRHALGCGREYLYSHGERLLSSREAELFLDCVRRRAGGEPAQYITGHQEFMSLDFKVAPGVLIPRPDTETLVEAALAEARALEAEGRRSIDILDIGTGSGCIAVSLACYCSMAHVTAVDISETALAIAGSNAISAGAAGRVRLMMSDLFSALDPGRDSFDIIVSNPPYIPAGDIGGLMREVREYEPLLALDGGPDGLSYYRRIAAAAPQFLRRGGLMALEVGFDQAEKVAGILGPVFSKIGVLKDVSGIKRVVTAQETKVIK